MDASGKFSISKWLRSRAGLTLIAFLAIATFFLITEHTAHLFGILPYALLFMALPLYLFTRREQKGKRESDDHQPEDRK